MSKASPFWNEISGKLGKRRLFYVCRDAERAFPLLGQPQTFIITNNSLFSQGLTTPSSANWRTTTGQATKFYNLIAIKNPELLDTWPLLLHPQTKKLIQPGDLILVFKSTPQIEKTCSENGWTLLNPNAKLAAEVEEKISQVTWLGPLKKFLPPQQLILVKNIRWEDKKFIVQFNRAHTGSGTLLIENKIQLDELKNKFPDREARVSEFIEGPLLTNNNIVWGNKTLLGNISYQITGLLPFTDRPFATIGNDWSLTKKILTNKQIDEYQKIALAVGQRLQKFGWKGLFGIDVILEEKTGQLFLLEINARQPASTTYESELQTKIQKTNDRLTTFEAHLGALLNLKLAGRDLIKIKNGAQIIARVPANQKLTAKKITTTITALKKLDLNILSYPNKKPGSDLLRIQSLGGLLEKHTKLNNLGQKIAIISQKLV